MFLPPLCCRRNFRVDYQSLASRLRKFDVEPVPSVDRQPTIENSHLFGKNSGGLQQITRAREVDHNLPCPLVLAYNCNVLVGEAA